MIIYRIVRMEFTDSLRASGAANRWNIARQDVIYASERISLCALELLAHTGGVRPRGDFGLMHIHVENEASVRQILQRELPEDWSSIRAYTTTQSIGAQWYETRESLLLKVPSAIIPSEYNLVLNTKHPDFTDMVSVKEVSDFFWDSRFSLA